MGYQNCGLMWLQFFSFSNIIIKILVSVSSNSGYCLIVLSVIIVNFDLLFWCGLQLSTQLEIVVCGYAVNRSFPNHIASAIM